MRPTLRASHNWNWVNESNQIGIDVVILGLSPPPPVWKPILAILIASNQRATHLESAGAIGEPETGINLKKEGWVNKVLPTNGPQSVW